MARGRVCINVSNGTKLVLVSEIFKDSPPVKEITFQRLNTYRKEHEHIIYEKKTK